MKASILSVACLAASVAATLHPARATTPPVDCRRDKNVIGRAICASPELTAIDKEIAALNDRGMVEFAPPDQRRLAQSQLAFFKHRNGCAWASHNSAHPGTAVAECIGAAMEERLHKLRTVVDRGAY